MYAGGATLEEIGATIGVSRERVRQLLKAAGVPARSSSDTFRLRRKQHLVKRDAILERYKLSRDANIVAEELEVPVSIVREVISVLPRGLAMMGKQKVKRFEDEFLLNCLREASDSLGGVLSCQDYNRFALSRGSPDIPWPSHQTMAKRFGSWRAALARAGLSSNPATPITGQLLFEEAHCIDALREVARAWGRLPTANEYEVYARASNGGVPSLPTIRNRFGTWFEALKAAGLV